MMSVQHTGEQTAGVWTASATKQLQERFRDVMAGVATPVSVVTGMDDHGPHGTTVSAFASLSMDPPMVLVSLANNSELLSLVRRTGRFGVNVLASTQSALALAFATKAGSGKFDGADWQPDTGVPRLDQALGWLVCEVQSLVEGGDHVVVLGLVVAADTTDGLPLTYHGRVFGTHAALDGSP